MHFPKPARRAISFAARAVNYVHKRSDEVGRHEHWRKKAEKDYRHMRDNLGRPELDRATVRSVEEYAVEVLGGSHFAPWLKVYALFQQRFVEGWIPENFFARRVLPRWESEGNFMGPRRTVARQFLATALIPDLAYRINGRWFDPEYRPIAPNQLADVVFAEHGEAYLKEEGLWQGLAVQRIGPDELGTAVAGLQRDAVIQRPVTQHPFFDEIYPDAVATLRLVTAFTDGDRPRFLRCRLRMARGGDRWVQSALQITCPVTDAEGTLYEEAHDRVWNPLSTHPDTGFRFAGARIPHLAEAVETCLELHGRIPHQRLIGWDACITPSGTTEIMEINTGHIGIHRFEATVGPIFVGCGFEQFA
jgi:hypothetical protein